MSLDSGTFYVYINAVADVPTVFGDSTSGSASQRVPLNIGGESTDKDVALGRDASEIVYYVVRYLNPEPRRERWALMTSGGAILGDNMGDKNWLLYSSDLSDLHLYAPHWGDDEYTLQFDITAIAVDAGRSRAQNTTTFTVLIKDPFGGPEEVPAPLPPILQVDDQEGNEDDVLTVALQASADPNDTTDPKISIVIYGIPEGAEINGVTYNPNNEKYVVALEDVEAGLVTVKPPKDFSGAMAMQVEAVATNSWALTAVTGPLPMNFFIDPVVDGVAISFAALQTDGSVRELYLTVLTGWTGLSFLTRVCWVCFS